MIRFFSRIFSILLIFTPSLGIFDCLHHGRLAALHSDYSANSSAISFSKVWEPLKIKDITDFLDMPVSVVSTIFIVMVLFHIFASSLTQKIILRKPLSAELLFQGLHSFISPPLHLDWELLFRQHTDANSVLFGWKRYVIEASDLSPIPMNNYVPKTIDLNVYFAFILLQQLSNILFSLFP